MWGRNSFIIFLDVGEEAIAQCTVNETYIRLSQRCFLLSPLVVSETLLS